MMTIRKKNNQIRSLRFGAKIFLSYLIVLLFPLSIWNVVSYRQANDTILNRVNTSFDESFSSLVYQINEKMGALDELLLLVANNTSVSTIVCHQYENRYMEYSDVISMVDPMLNSLRMFHPEINKIEIFTEGSIKGTRTMFKSFDELSAIDGSDVIMDSIDPVWLVRHDTALRADTVLLAKRVFSPENPFTLSVIFIGIDYSFIFGEGAMPDIQNHGVIVSDTNGNILFRRDAASLSAEETPHTLDEIFTETESPSDSGLIVRKGTLASGDWNIYMYANTNSLKLSPFDSFKTTLFFLLIIGGMMLFIAILFTRSFSRRISVLNTYTRSIVKNNFQNIITSDSKDEVGEITNSVGLMVLETRQLINEVHESHITQKAAEIKALQSQINPHFLYNTLSSINWMAIYSGDETISKIITNLSSFYRSTLNSGSVTTIEHELETTKTYIGIQLLIHKNSFDVSFNIEPSILEYQIPSILLQPIVENAIEHGIRVLPEELRGEIIISAYEKDDDILFDIFDNGPGLSDEEIMAILESDSKGYGVKNVNDRLKLFFDDTYGITFTSVPGGLTVTIRVPKYIELKDEC